MAEVKFTAPVTPQLRREIESLAEQPLSAAQITRSAGATAELLGQRRPSYERVRVLVGQVRHPRRRLFAAAVLLNLAFRIRGRRWCWSLRVATSHRARK